MKRSLPQTPQEWFAEIELAYEDAHEAKPFGKFAGTTITDADLFHLAPLVCMKFRGLDQSDEQLRNRVTEGALANYVANTGEDAPVDHGLESNPRLAFALCYVTAHLVLDLIDETAADEILCFCEEQW
jgi:hypothetical protein